MFGGVYTFEHEPEGKEDRMMEILFIKREVKPFANAVIEELSGRYILNACRKDRLSPECSAIILE